MLFGDTSFLSGEELGSGYHDLSALWAGGELGDWWRFDLANTDANSYDDPILSAVGRVNGHVMTAPDSSNAPKLQIANGCQEASFDGTLDRLVYSFGSTLAQAGTIIISLGTVITNNSTAIVTGSSATSRWQISVDGSNRIVAYAGATLLSTLSSPPGEAVFTVEFNGASTVFRKNGTTLATGNAGTQGTDQITLGAIWDGTNGWSGHIYSVLIIDRLLTSAERDMAERAMGSHGAIGW